MITVNVLLSGRLKLDGYGEGHETNGDGTYHLDLKDGAIAPDVIDGMGVPAESVSFTMVNGHVCHNGTALHSGDRVVLVPPDVAALWRHLGSMNGGREGPVEF